ncbi:MAG: serine/threonine-protein kinase [Propionibacteriaceae bacterium]|nr:serine/threonine-protein kinase [Propionibacteriaceae bacterium]
MERLRPRVVLADRYRLIGHVASGGMGQVWDGFDDVLERRVALKIMHPHTQEEHALVERFRSEAKFAAQVEHPNIVTVHDYVEDGGLSCLVMEFIDGPTLGAVLSRGPLPPDQVRTILYEMAQALVVAHEAQIIHRDIKPANVMVPETGAKLTDFGIARSVGSFSQTMTGQVLGTAHYLSPEQALGQEAGPPSDVYGLGVLGFEMLTGEKPFVRQTPIATALAHVQDEPPSLPGDTPPELKSLITDCLAKNPDERPTAAFIVDLLAPGPAEPEPPVAEPDATVAMSVVPRRAMVD